MGKWVTRYALFLVCYSHPPEKEEGERRSESEKSKICEKHFFSFSLLVYISGFIVGPISPYCMTKGYFLYIFLFVSRSVSMGAHRVPAYFL